MYGQVEDVAVTQREAARTQPELGIAQATVLQLIAPSLAVEARAMRRTSAAGPSSLDQSNSSGLTRSTRTMSGG
jgi:hypothetical protein